MFSNKEYVLAVYRQKSFSKAATELYISQPSLSATIKRLEAKLGSPIFDRSTNPVSLTEIGAEYVRQAMEIQQLEENFQKYLYDHLNMLAGTVRIGGSNLFASFILPSMISRFKQRYPQIAFEIVEDSTQNLITLLVQGTLDLVIDNAVLADEGILSRTYREEMLLLAVPASFPVNDRLKEYQLSAEDIRTGRHWTEKTPSISLKLFREEPFVFLRPENDTGSRARRMCANQGFVPQIVFELDQQVTAFNIANSGMGIAFVSDTLIRHSESHPAVLYYKIVDPEKKRKIFFYEKANRYLSKACRVFLEETMKETDGSL